MDLRDVLRILLRRLWVVVLVTAASFVTMVAVRYYTKKDEWRASATFLLLPSQYDATQIFYQDPQYPIAPRSIADRIQLLNGDRAGDLVKKALEAHDPPLMPASISLTAGADEKSLLVTVAADSEQEARDTIEVLRTVYYEFDEALIDESLERAQKLVVAQLDAENPESKRRKLIDQRIRADQKRAEEFAEINVVDPELDVKIRGQQIGTLYSALVESQRVEAETAHELDAIRRRRQGSQINRVLESQDVPAPLLPPPTPETHELYQEMARLNAELDRARRRYQDGYDKVEEVRDRLNALQSQIRAVARGPNLIDVQVAERKIELLRANQEFLKELIGSEKDALRKIGDKLRTVQAEDKRTEALQAEVDRLEERGRDIEERLKLKPPNIELLRTPTAGLATVQFESSTWLMILLVSVVLGVASAYVLEYLNDTIRTVADVKTYMNLPTIGLIPEFKGVPHNLLEVAIKSPPYEYYNKLATFVEAALQDKGRKLLMVTSAKEEEGKSSVCANLAIALAQSGRRVAIVDADMRKGQMHVIFGLERGVGLSTVLEEAPEAEMPALMQTGVETLKVLPSGPVPVNPLLLLRGERATRLLEHLEQSGQFDVVLVDTPPLMGVIDAAVIASHGLPTIMVVQDNVVRRAEMNHVRANLMRVNADILGVILNKSKIEPETYYYYYYRYRGYSA